MTEIRNVYCVGRNYRNHAQELGNEVPTQPMLFTKPTHAVVWADGQGVALPGNVGAIHYEVELVIHIGRDYQAGVAVDALVDWMALGIDFTLRDVQTQVKQLGQPWLPAKGFKNSAVLTQPIPFPGALACQEQDFALRRNGDVVQRGNLRDLIFPLQTLIDFTANHYGLGAGDILYTGTPAGVGPVADGDVLQMLWGDQALGAFTVSVSI